MKTSILSRNGVSSGVAGLIYRIVGMVPWPARRRAMADVTRTLLDGKPRIAENAFGWNRSAVELGMNEYRTGITCVLDLRSRRKPKTEEKYPQMLEEIRKLMEPHSQADPKLRTALAYTNMTASAVWEALQGKGWSEKELPTIRTMSEMLNRHGYRLRTVVKTQVQKKRRIPMQYSRTSDV